MATFDTNTVGSDVSPSYSPALQISPNVVTVKMGDGYEQRLHKGLNVAPRTWKLKFDKRTNSVTTNILNFLASSTGGNNGQKAFDWSPPYGLSGKWKCQQWSVTNVSYDLNDISLEFIEVFEA
tara:strand:- start:2369 stop:2737 length:369 start_codon:yes stop_codon:yes gene_type:complete